MQKKSILKMNKDPNSTFSIFSNFPDMYFLISAAGEINSMNLAASNLIKEKDANESYTEIFDLIELCDRNEAVKIFNYCIREHKSKQYKTRFFINRKLIDVNLTFSIPFSEDDVEFQNSIIVIARDITEDKKKEDDLLRFHNVANGSVNPVLITDITGKMIYVNPAFVKVTGYTREELIGRNPKIFGSGKMGRKFWDKVWAQISSGKVWSGEIEDTKKNGEAFHSHLLISPILDKDEKVNGYFGIHRDLSEKRILEKQLIHTQKMESIGTLAAGIAHEVGNPLASISALVQVVQRDSEDQFVKEKLGLVKSQVTRISKIIRDLVDFSRPSNYELRLTDINHSIREAVNITRVGTKAKNVEFNINLSEEVPSLPLIPDQLEQVFLNILINAIDAINEDELNKKSSKIDVSSLIEDDQVVITFSDTGPGIKEDDVSKVFEPFFTTKEQGKGTGLGLWVSYGIIKSFQGDIKIKSELRKGTSFIITIPIET
jgi:PAS domain S-box-containing protein